MNILESCSLQETREIASQTLALSICAMSWRIGPKNAMPFHLSRLPSKGTAANAPFPYAVQYERGARTVSDTPPPSRQPTTPLMKRCARRFFAQLVGWCIPRAYRPGNWSRTSRRRSSKSKGLWMACSWRSLISSRGMRALMRMMGVCSRVGMARS